MFVHSIDTRRSLTGAAVLAAAIVFGLSPAVARSVSQHSAPRVLVAERAGDDSAAGDTSGTARIAPAEAARRASHRYGGRVLNVVLEDGPSGPYYRVKLLDGGRMRVVRVEARQ